MINYPTLSEQERLSSKSFIFRFFLWLRIVVFSQPTGFADRYIIFTYNES